MEFIMCAFIQWLMRALCCPEMAPYYHHAQRLGVLPPSRHRTRTSSDTFVATERMRGVGLSTADSRTSMPARPTRTAPLRPQIACERPGRAGLQDHEPVSVVQ